MNIIGDLIISVIAGGLHEKLKVTLKENHTNKLIDNLKRTASSNSLELHQNELYYNALDAYVSKNNIVPRLIEICYHKGSPNFKTKEEFAKDQVDIFTDNNKKYLGARSELIEIFENLYATVDSTLNNVEEKDRILFNAIKELEHVIKGKIVVPKPSHPRHITKQPGLADKYFAHRDETVENLYEAIKQDRKRILININGLGGVGKTTVARALFHKAKDEFKHIAWVEYQHNIKESLLNSFTISNDIKEDTEARYRRIEKFLLNATKDTLLFIDNVTDDSDLNFIEVLKINVVITSRIGDIGNFEDFPLYTLSEDQCLDIFYKYYDYERYDENKEQEGAARNLINLVKCHTLSVELLARAANRPGYPLDKYEADLKAKGFGYPDRNVKTAHSNDPKNKRTIAEHLVKLFELVEVNDKQQRILKNFSLMPSTEIPAEVDKWLNCNIDDIMRLAELGWLDESSGYHMHTIIKEAIRLQYPQAQYEDCIDLIGYMSGDGYIKRADVYTKVHERLNIAEAVMECFCGVEKEEVGLLFNNIAIIYDNQGEYDKALTWYYKALEIDEKILGTDHYDTATTYNNIAVVYNNQGKYDDALTWHYKALGIREKKLGTDHPDTAITYNNIAAVYDNQGKYDDALTWYHKALGIREKKLGTDHLDTATTYNNIAAVYDNQGKYDDALTWYHKALGIREKKLGTDHPDTATIYNNIAAVYDNQGKYDDALKLCHKALEIYEKKLGTDHPDTATTYNNIAAVYDNQGKYDDALTWHYKALEIIGKKLGTDHPHTALTYNNIALVYDNQGKYDDALEWHYKAFRIISKQLGENHPHTRTVIKSMQYAYSAHFGKDADFTEWLKNRMED